MPVAKKAVLDSRHRKELLPKENEEWRKKYVLSLPRSEPGEPSREKRALARYASDPAAFIFEVARTFDNHDYENPYKQFPDTPDLRVLVEFIHRPDPVLCIAKSRQLMVTWITCAYMVWLARFHPAQALYAMCKQERDAKALVFEDDWLSSRCAFIEYALPPLFWQEYDGRYTHVKSGKLIYPHGSFIVGVPEGAHQLRSRVGSFVLIDEAAFMDDFRGTYQAILAMTKGGGRARIVSTARYGSDFGTLIEADKWLSAA